MNRGTLTTNNNMISTVVVIVLIFVLGFQRQTTANRCAAFIRRSKPTGFCPNQLDDFNSLCHTADNQYLLRFNTTATMFYKLY